MPLHTPQAVIPVPSGPGCVLCKECVTEKERESLAGRLVFYTMYKREEKRGEGNNNRTESPAGSHASSIVISEC